jgi:hypothetical protein
VFVNKNLERGSNDRLEWQLECESITWLLIVDYFETIHLHKHLGRDSVPRNALLNSATRRVLVLQVCLVSLVWINRVA